MDGLGLEGQDHFGAEEEGVVAHGLVMAISPSSRTGFCRWLPPVSCGPSCGGSSGYAASGGVSTGDKSLNIGGQEVLRQMGGEGFVPKPFRKRKMTAQDA